MNYDKLHQEFKEWQNTQPSLYEIQYKKFLGEKLANEDIKQTLIDFSLTLLELKREFKDFLESNTPGMYD